LSVIFSMPWAFFLKKIEYKDGDNYDEFFKNFEKLNIDSSSIYLVSDNETSTKPELSNQKETDSALVRRIINSSTITYDHASSYESFESALRDVSMSDVPEIFPMVCDVLSDRRNHLVLYKIALSVCQYIIPLIVLCVTYTIMVYFIHFYKRELKNTPNSKIHNSGAQKRKKVGKTYFS
jgi:hypothetical protein